MTDRVEVRVADHWTPAEVLSWSLEGGVWWVNVRLEDGSLGTYAEGDVRAV